VALGFKTRTLVVLVLAALNVAVTPLGTPEAVKLTLLLKPFCPATLIVLLTLLVPPTRRVALLIEEERPKLGVGMVNTMGVELVKVPEVPVTVNGYVPETTVLLALNVSELVPLVLMGPTVVVTPLGNPVTPKPTAPAKPFCAVMVRAVLAVFPT